jgi:GxxExxY protein
MDLLKSYKQKDEKTYAIIGAAMRVHRELGPGFLEAVYGDALEVEFRNRHIPYEREKELDIMYDGIPLKTKYYADFLCYGDVVVELKTVETIANIHRAQVIHYLKATGLSRGLIINFKNLSLQYERIANDY